jgi:CrcB protein
MKNLLLVFIGGGFGSVLRFVLGKWLNNSENGIPYGTFVANVLGSLLIGFILGYAAKNDALSQNSTLLLATGFCGGFTTFSTFAYENHIFLKIRRFYFFCILYYCQFCSWVFSSFCRNVSR